VKPVRAPAGKRPDAALAARVLGLAVLAILTILPARGAASGGRSDQPNVLWLTCEDTGPHLGCYGDAYARTPRLDALAARGLRYSRVWSTAPVCAPARTTILTGCYPSSLGAEHMRSHVPLPTDRTVYPRGLRAAGYYCSNNSKEDYNLALAGPVWDESSPRAHWRKRATGQPFFAVFNFTESHESQIRRTNHVFVHDPARAPVPPYMPDLPEVREGWAQYYDQVSVIDARAGRVLDELAADGLADDTIVFFYGDHGSGMPRNKRSACNSGLQVPLIVHFPERWRHLAPPDYRAGGVSDRLIAFVDLAPTVASLAGVKPPSGMQGRAFAGPFLAPPAKFLHGLRGRMDERYDLVRSVTDGRFVYVRNYLPHRPHGQHNEYMFQTPATAAWKRRFDAGALPPVQAAFWQPKEPEELYDLQSDPSETANLATDPAQRRTLARLRRAHRDHTLAIRDVGLLPEAEMLRRAAGGPPGDLASQSGPGGFDVRRVFAAAELAARRDLRDVPRLLRCLADGDSGVRWWGAMGFLIRGPAAVEPARERLRALLADESPSVRVAAAEALAAHGAGDDRKTGREALLSLADAGRNPYFVSVAALDALDNLAAPDPEERRRLEALPRRQPGVNARMADYLERLLRHRLDEGADGAAPPGTARP
jgi:arylsulfatase A-like enzyme